VCVVHGMQRRLYVSRHNVLDGEHCQKQREFVNMLDVKVVVMIKSANSCCATLCVDVWVVVL